MPTAPESPTFIIPLPDGRVARVPLAVLEDHADPEARAHHGVASSQREPPRAGDALGLDKALISFDASANPPSHDVSEWHVEWELGTCVYDDGAGNPISGVRWHRHPLGTEYTEIYTP